MSIVSVCLWLWICLSDCLSLSLSLFYLGMAVRLYACLSTATSLYMCLYLCLCLSISVSSVLSLFECIAVSADIGLHNISLYLRLFVYIPTFILNPTQCHTLRSLQRQPNSHPVTHKVTADWEYTIKLQGETNEPSTNSIHIHWPLLTSNPYVYIYLPIPHPPGAHPHPRWPTLTHLSCSGR